VQRPRSGLSIRADVAIARTTAFRLSSSVRMADRDTCSYTKRKLLQARPYADTTEGRPGLGSPP
jgi:hypothetical protein